MPKKPYISHAGPPADDETPVYISDRVQAKPISDKRMVITIHYYPDAESYAAKKAEKLDFLFTSEGAEVMANGILRASAHQREVDNKRKPIDLFRVN